MTDRVRTELELDLSRALRQLDDLERELDALLQPITIPVTLQGEQALDQLRTDIRQVEAEDVNVDVDVQGINQAENQIEELRVEVDRTGDEFDDMGDKAQVAGRQIDDVGRRGRSAFGGLATTVAGLGIGLGIAAGARAFIGFAQDAIAAASDLEESTSKARIVFGEFAGEIEQFAGSAPQALGLANQEALEFTATFGNLFVALGLSQQAAADLSPEIVQLGADLASFNNIPVSDALEKLRAGLVGEAEPLRVLGVSLSEAAVQAKATELGLVGVNDQLTEAEKVQARYAIIVEQTATAQGDFARTADSTANTLKTVKAELAGFSAEAGQALLPAFRELLEIAPDLVAALEGLIPILVSIATTAGVVAVAVGEITGVVTEAEAAQRAYAIQTGLAADSALLLKGSLFLAAQEVRRFDESSRTGETRAEALAAAFEGIVGASTATPASIRAVIANLDELGQQAGLTAPELEFLADLLENRLQGRDAQQNLIAINEALDGTGPAAVEAAGGVEEFTSALEGLDLTDFNASVAEIASDFAGLPDALDAAAAAMKTTEGEIVTDFGDFVENLGRELEARRAFNDNVALLRAFGLDQLADAFTEAGLEAADALAEAVADPAAAARAEASMDEFGREQAATFAQSFLAFLATQDLTAEVRLELIRGNLDLGDLNFGGEIVVNGAVSGGGGSAPTIVNNFYETPTPTTATQRITQSTTTLRS